MRILPGEEVLDVGCGSGLFGLAAARMGASRVLLTDIDPRAVRCALANARTNGLRVAEGRAGDLFSPCPGERFDVIIGNLPQTPGPRRFDPARWGGRDGARHLIRFLREAPGHLRPGGRIYFVLTGLADRARLLRAARGRFRFRTLVLVKKSISPADYDDLLPGLFSWLERLRRAGRSRFTGRGGRFRMEVRFCEGRLVEM
jgi:methylase of polypeptide subunit release factors